MKNKLQILFVCLVIVTACKKDNNTSSPTGLIYTYYPTNVGHELIYDVSLITKDEFTGVEDTSNYQLKEVIESIFMDNQNRPTQRLERYVRDTPNDPWIINDVWTSNLTATNLERKEENVTYVKMVFPISLNLDWNGNVFNALGYQPYEYTAIHVPAMLNSFSFDSTLTVLQKDDDNAIETYYEEERFANHVGLIYKEQIEKHYLIPGQLLPLKSQRLYVQTLISYSN